MITLYQFPYTQGLSLSAFCLKVEVFLKLAKIPYQKKSTSSLKAPKKKLPFIIDGDLTIPDSSEILRYLMTKYGLDWHAKLNPRDLATAHAAQTMLEEHLYWIAVYFRWVEPKMWAKVRVDFFANMPAYLQLFVPQMVQKGMKKALWMQGLGRHSEEDLIAMAQRDLFSLSMILGENKFIAGASMSMYDASIYAFVRNLLWPEYAGKLAGLAEKHDNLVSYTERIESLLR
jgi:glutathione S-transferase